MNKLERIREIGFKITWKLVKIGYFGDKFIQPQITKQDISEYACSLLEKMEANYNEIAQLANMKIEDYEIDHILNELIKLEDSNIELQCQKWIVYLTKEMIKNLGSNYFENLLTITEFWVSLGQPENSPHIFQAVKNQITPQEYYTEEMYNLILHTHKKWIDQEIKRIIQLEK